MILLHASGGLSLEQAALRAREQGLVDVSPVALFKRLRTSGPWLEWMTAEMVKEQSKTWDAAAWGLRPIRILDATDILEPGPRGTDWRLHYSLRLPQLSCDFLKVTDATEGETLKRLPVRRGDIVLADRGYSHRAGVAQILKQGARCRRAPQFHGLSAGKRLRQGDLAAGRSQGTARRSMPGQASLVYP